MLNKDFAGTTASIAKSFTNPAQIVKQDNWGELLGQAVQNYQTAKYKNDASEALAAGDMAGFENNLARINPIAAANYKLQQQQSEENNRYKQIELALRKQALEQKQNQSGLTNAAKNYEYLLGQGMSPEQARAIAFGGNTEAVGGALVSGGLDSLGMAGAKEYDKQKGAALAKEEAKQREKAQLYENNISDIDDLINSISQNPGTVGWTAPYVTAIARLTGADDAYLGQRGENVRKLGTIQNNLISEAKAAGQSGINTVAEIEQATKGLNENSSAPEVLGALKAMRNSISKLREKQNKAGNDANNDPLGLR